MQKSLMNYRADIDGLRAVAILSIFLFHVNPRWLHGGYVGVDIFFVISGYLISKIIYKEINSNRFSLIHFYERRARRILPAMLSIVVLCTIAAYVLFYPQQFVSFSYSALASILFSANLFFYSTIDYFSPATNETLLLHLWSLGIEEQFYIFFPLLALFFFKKSSRTLSIIIISAIVLSLFASQWFLGFNPPAAFYLLPFRTYELLLGCFIALVPIPATINKRTLWWSCFIGVLLVLGAIVFLRPTTPFPGLAAAIPCLGTAIILWTGEQRHFLIHKILSLRIFVGLGLISYSLYLVHWPIICLAKYLYPNASGALFRIAVISLCFILAILNYYLIEKPFRHKTIHFNAKNILINSGLSISVVAITLGVLIHYQNNVANTLDTRIKNVLAYLQYNAKPIYLSGQCLDFEPGTTDTSSCLPQGKNKIMIWGDSHAIHLYPGLKDPLKEEGYSLGVLTHSGCQPIIGYEIAARPLCKLFNETTLASILKVKPRILIMTANWVVTEEYMDQLEKTIQEISKHGIKIVLLGQSPWYKEYVPKIIAEQIQAGKKITATPNMLELDILTHDETIMGQRFSNRSDVRYISVMKLMCPNNICPLITEDETPVHFDIAHLTEAGSKLFAQKLIPEFLKNQEVSGNS